MRRRRSRISAAGICAAISASAISRSSASNNVLDPPATPRRSSTSASTPPASSASASATSSTTGSAPTSPVSIAAIRNSSAPITITYRRRLVGTDIYHATKSEWVVLANAYVDLGTWWCMTPFIGAGVGGARVSITTSPTRASPSMAAARCRLSPSATTCRNGISPGRCMPVSPTRSPELHRRTRLSLPRHGRRPDRRSPDLRRHQHHRQPDRRSRTSPRRT